jgi:hypothetical protein
MKRQEDPRTRDRGSEITDSKQIKWLISILQKVVRSMQVGGLRRSRSKDEKLTHQHRHRFSHASRTLC